MSRVDPRWAGPRWVLVAAAAVALVGLAYLCLAEAERPPRLGVRAVERAGQLVVNWVQPAGPAWDAGVRPGDVVVALDGAPVAAREVPAAPPTTIQVRSRADVLVSAAASDTAASLLTTAPRRWGFLALAACFAVVGGLVFVLAEGAGAARALLGFALAAATALIAALATRSGAAWALGLEFLALVAFGAATVLLFLAFPVDRLRTRAGRRVAAGCVGVHLALALLYVGVVAIASAAYTALQAATFAILALDLAGAAGLVVAALVRTPARQRETRRALGLVALGALGGLLPFCLLVLIPRALGFGYLAAPEIAILSIGLLPVSLGAAIVDRQFLGVTRLVRRGLVALLVWMGLLGGYSLGLDALHHWAEGRQEPIAATLAPTGVILAAILATFPLAQGRLRRALEGHLFRDVYDYAATLEDLGTEIARLTSAEAIAGHVLARLGATLDLSWAVITVATGGPPVVLARWGACPRDPATPAPPAGGGTLGPREGLPDGWRARSVPLVVDGAITRMLIVGPKRHDVVLLPEDGALLATLGPLVAAALQSALLVRRLEAQVAVLGERERELAALSARLLRVQEEERRRIALDLHDDPLQRTILLTRKVGAALACPQAREWHQDTEEIGDSLRAICLDLRPPVLDDLGLVAGLEQLVAGLRPRADLVTCFAVEGPDDLGCARLPGDLEVALYRVAQEALNNCLKHARATTVRVTLRRGGRRVTLRVADDGRGYDAGAAREAPGHPLHLGILGMRERLRPWGGDLAVERAAAGGTVVTAAVEVGGCDGRTA